MDITNLDHVVVASRTTLPLALVPGVVETQSVLFHMYLMIGFLRTRDRHSPPLVLRTLW